MKFKFEPSYIDNVRNVLKNYEQKQDLFFSEDDLSSFVMSDITPQLRDYQFIDDEKIEKLSPCKGRDYVLCCPMKSMYEKPWFEPLWFGRAALGDIIVSTSQQEIKSFPVAPVGFDGFRFNPDMTIMMDERTTPTRTSSGTATLFDLVRNIKIDASSYVLSPGLSYDNCCDIARDLVSNHVSSRASVTCLVKKCSDADHQRGGLVWANNMASIYDASHFDERPSIVEHGVYVLSREVFSTKIKWELKKRRYHHEGKIWYQFERDLSQLTRMFETNYVIIE